jgi:hypothetical protein
LGTSPEGLTKLCSECGLVDIVATTHPPTEFATCSKGTTVIDYILVAPDLLPAVKSCGYEPFNVNILSDHRGVYVDFSTNHLFGDNIRPLAPISARDISTKKPHQLEPYFQHKHKDLEQHQWYTQIKDLQDKFDDDIEDNQLAEKLYTRLYKACQYAGERLKPFPPAPYSPAVVKMRTIQSLLRLAITQYTSQYDFTETLEEIRGKLDSAGFELPPSLDECRRALDKHNKEFKAIIREETRTKQQRREHLEQLIATRDSNGDTDKAKIIRSIKRAEKQQRTFQKCRNLRFPNRQGGLAHVLIPEDPNDNPKTCTSWIREDRPEVLEKLIEDRNVNHFSQSKNSAD